MLQTLKTLVSIRRYKKMVRNTVDRPQKDLEVEIEFEYTSISEAYDLCLWNGKKSYAELF